VTLTVRRARSRDKNRILEISSRIWDGVDYVPSVLDEWLADDTCELAVTERDGIVIAFARRSWLMPGYAWFQGIRSDPAYRGRGAGRALTEHLIEQTTREGADTIGLSTYIDNEASIHIIASHGFRRTASFVLTEIKEIRSSAISQDGPTIHHVDVERARAFIADSAWHTAANGYYMCDWTVYPFARSPEIALASSPYRVGITDGVGSLRSLLCLSAVEDDGYAFVSFLDGSTDDFQPLLAHAVRDLGIKRGAAMVPRKDGRTASAYDTFARCGWAPWRDGSEDVFGYELTIDSASRHAI